MRAFALEHWYGLALVAVLGYVGHVVKRRMPDRSTGVVALYWRSLPLHPVLVGALACLVPTAPVWAAAAEAGWAGRAGYGALAGVASTFAWDVWRTWAKRRGLLTGTSNPP